MSEHLGGYVPGGDEATFFPDLWRWFVTEQGVGSVLDVGCGDGVALDYFASLGCSAYGVDGVSQEHPRIQQWDYNEGPLDLRGCYPFDLCWSCEFVEHVEERFVPNFLATFKRAGIVAITHATQGQPGHHHVNCRPADYWVGAMAAIGYAFDEETTVYARGLATLNTSPWNHFVRSGLVFRRCP